MINKINKKTIAIIIIIGLIALLFIFFKSHTTKLSKDDAIEMDCYKISYNENPGEYQGQL